MKKWDKYLQNVLIILLLVLVAAYLHRRWEKSQPTDIKNPPPQSELAEGVFLNENQVDAISLIARRICVKNNLCSPDKSEEKVSACAAQLKNNLDFANYISVTQFSELRDLNTLMSLGRYHLDMQKFELCQNFIEKAACPISLEPYSNLRDCDKILITE